MLESDSAVSNISSLTPMICAGRRRSEPSMFARIHCVSILAAALSCSILVAQQKAEAPAGPLEKAAGSFVSQLAEGEFAKATSSFDAAMLKAMPADSLK